MSDADSDYEHPPMKAIIKPPRRKHRPRPKFTGKCTPATYDASVFAELPLIDVYQFNHADFKRYCQDLGRVRVLSPDEQKQLNAIGTKIKNREYARASRIRNKVEMCRLEDDLGDLTMDNMQLKEEGRRLRDENAVLRKTCAVLCASVEDLQIQNKILLAQIPLSFETPFWYDQ